MKKILACLSILLITVGLQAAKPKYVFYFIGDGMGTNHVLMTEMYLASLEGNVGVKPLCFTQFPVASVSMTWSADRNVTDSPAAGTALATGEKTRNGAISVDPEGKPLETLAEAAAAAGRAVGIVTTSSANDATPAAFVSHQPSRKNGYEIMLEMIDRGYAFYGGAALIHEDRTFDRKPVPPIRPLFEAAGYTICNPAEFRSGYQDMEKVLMLPGDGQEVSYAIDALGDGPENQEKHVTFSDFVSSALTFLARDPKQGFFLMAEAGEIDHAAHSHDAATVIQEVLDMDAGVRIAFDFYRKHPRQTLIVIASDHETGGLTFAPREPRHLARLQVQKHSMNVLSDMLKERMVSQKAILTWDETKAFLGGELGLWKSIKVSWEDEKMLRDIYEATIAKRDPGSAKDLYADNSKIVSAAVDVLNRSCRIYWSGAHTSGYVPVFAIGPGSELFSRRMDNVDVARMIRQAAF